MGTPKIIVCNEIPRHGDSFVAPSSLIVFDLYCVNNETINIDTLEIFVNRNYKDISLTERYTPLSTQLSVSVLENDKKFRISLDLDPNSHIKFRHNENVAVRIRIKNYLDEISNLIVLRYCGANFNYIDAINDLLSEINEISVDNEIGRIEPDKHTVSFSYDNWSLTQEPTVRLNGELINSGYIVNKARGVLIFNNELSVTDPVDIIEANYKHGVFSDRQLISFMKQAIHVYNSYPRHSNYNLRTIPPEGVAAAQIGGALYALYAIVNGTANPQFAIRFVDIEKREEVLSIIKNNISSYENIFKEICVNKKVKYATPGAIIMPEYTLPGGRSRFFRHIFTGGTE